MGNVEDLLIKLKHILKASKANSLDSLIAALCPLKTQHLQYELNANPCVLMNNQRLN